MVFEGLIEDTSSFVYFISVGLIVFDSRVSERLVLARR